ncbi:MAG: Gfo/Idh/MocA family oxidoreductase [Candidatus Shapirobacteria bacterium]
MKKVKSINFGIIGCGVAGNRHAQAISKIKNAKLVGVTSFSGSSAINLASKYSGVLVMSLVEMMKSEAIDVICICSPNKFHARQAIMAINNQKHVIVEKPLALKVGDAQKILSLSLRKHVIVTVVLPRRFDKTWQGISKLFKKQILHHIQVVNLEQYYFRNDSYYTASSWHGKKELDGGVLLTQGIHYIDLLENLIDLSYQDKKIDLSHISRINSIGIKLKRNLEVADTVSSQFLLDKKVLGSINISTSAYPGYSSKIFILCQQGSIVVVNDKIVSWGIVDVPKPGEGSSGWDEKSVIPIIKDMINSINTALPPKINLSSVVRSLELTLALNKSI